MKNIFLDILYIIIIVYFIHILLNYVWISKLSRSPFINLTNIYPKKNSNNNLITMKKLNVIFCGTVRNADNNLQNILDYIKHCGLKFNNYSVIIYENDSNDNTRNILNDNKKSNYYYIFEDGIKEPRRTMRISNGRNKILSKIREINKDNYYNYMIMLDLDDVNKTGKFVETIDTCFDYDIEEWDVLTGNQSDFYYDLWALRKKYDMEIDCWKKIKLPDGSEQKYYNTLLNPYKIYYPSGLLEVNSAFGGIAIYKLSSILEQCNYVGKYNDESEKCEHVEFNECIKNNGGFIYINTKFLTN